ncbi:MAG TPA: hypothetical protein VF574_12145 [Allosphingosinicella sp.]|jgi:soluble cytochrome b562
MKNQIPLIDRLDERGLVDRWGFVLFAFVGSIAIVLAKHLAIGAILVALGAIALLLAYAWLVHSRGTAKLRSDQAGDNCYYLGLIYTLASLAYAIFTFDPANTATTIVQGFGIALATTISGLVLRVFFNQSRVDLYEVEDSARLELAQAASRLKTELSHIAVSFSDFGHQTQQIISEARDIALSSIEEGAKRSIDAVTQAATAAQEALTSKSTDLGSQARELSAATDKVVASMERNAERLDGAAESSGRFAAVMNSVQQAAEAAREAAQSVSAEVSQAATSHASLLSAAERVDRLVAETSASLRTFQEGLDERLREVEDGPKKAFEGAFDMLSGTTLQLRSAVDELIAAHRRSAESIDSETSAVVTALRSHNSELESELGRSRHNVSKVHSAMVEMTDSLLAQVERRAS